MKRICHQEARHAEARIRYGKITVERHDEARQIEAEIMRLADFLACPAPRLLGRARLVPDIALGAFRNEFDDEREQRFMSLAMDTAVERSCEVDERRRLG